MKTNLVLNFTPFGIKSEVGSGSNKLHKNISLETLKNVLNKSSEFDTGFMNLSGLNYIGVKRYIKCGQKEILLIEAAPAIRTVIYEDRTHSIPYPGLLMSVMCRKSSNGKVDVTGTFLHATIGPLFRDTDTLYRFPFANVYSDATGRICWGEVKLSPYNTIQKASGLMQLFLSSKMNNDLYHSPNHQEAKTLGGFLEYLNGTQEFPYDCLLKCTMTVKDLVKYMKSKNA